MKALFTLLFFLFPSLLFGQIREISIKTGITSSLINVTYFDANNNALKYNTTAAQSFYTQLNTQFYHYQNFSLQAGVGLIEKRSEFYYRVPIVGSPDSLELKTDLETRAFFFEIDAKMKILIPELPRIVPYAIVGPQFSFLNRKTASLPFGITSPQVQGVVGFGADIDLQKLNFFIEYNRFVNFNTNYSTDPQYEFRESSNAFLIGLKFLVLAKKN